MTATQGTEDEKFRFYAQGDTDGQWIGATIWTGALINLFEPMKNGTKTCAATVSINEAGAGISRFNLGFRCDYWSSGKFCVRNVKVERGTVVTE